LPEAIKVRAADAYVARAAIGNGIRTIAAANAVRISSLASMSFFSRF
jgi:hypothetical protein